MYDAVAEAIPLAQQGQNRKKALLVISDGNDTSSATARPRAEGADSRDRGAGLRHRHRRRRRADARASRRRAAAAQPRRCRFPFPGGPVGRRRRRRLAAAAAHRRRRRRWVSTRHRPSDDRVNVVALRDMTDDSGGRTEIIRDARDLNPATASIADELSKQVLPRLSVQRQEGRPLALDPRRGAQPHATASARAGIRRELATIQSAIRNPNPNRMSRACSRDRARPEPPRQLRRSARRLVARPLPRRTSAPGWCRGWSATPSARCSAWRCSRCCPKR